VNGPWRIARLERVTPTDPDFIWATFDVEFNGGDIVRQVSILQQPSGDFRLSGLEASSNTRDAIISAVLAELAKRPV
jgi:hypothetical protein